MSPARRRFVLGIQHFERRTRRRHGQCLRPDQDRQLTRRYGDSLLDFSQQRRFSPGMPLRSRLWAGFAGCKGAAEPALERCDPFGCPQRSPDGGRPFDPRRRRWVGRCSEKCCKIGDQRAMAPP
jgi:hypothetical protein